jgi:hypothetical protein
MRSHQLWTTLADNLQEQGLDPMVELGWKKTGIVIVTLSFYNFSLYVLQFWVDSNQRVSEIEAVLTTTSLDFKPSHQCV